MHTKRSITRRWAAVTALAVLLGGCSTVPLGDLTEAQIAALHQSISKEFTPMNLAANKDWLSGHVALDITIDRNNQLLGCKAKSIAGDPGLVEVAERACWAMVFPLLPAQVFNAEGKTTIRMPLIFSMPEEIDPQRRARFEAILFPAFSQGQYFRDNGLSSVATRSVGQAQFRYIADREGKVLACDVLIAAVEGREAEFWQSPPWVSQLRTACLGMNLAKMPGFAVSSNGLATGSVWTTYAPWRRVGLKVGGEQ